MLLEEFVSVMDEELENLCKAVENGSADEIKHYAHKMKGAAANMMAEDIRFYCNELQNADKTDTAKVKELYENIKKSVAEFKEQL